jgi:signal recognition particle receptor subunit alpha
MLDHFVIFTRGGAVLWEKSFSPLKGDPIGDLIRTALLQRSSGKSRVIDDYNLKWSFANDVGLGLVFLAVSQRFMALTYVERLLERAQLEFLALCRSAALQAMATKRGRYCPEAFAAFDAAFEAILAECEGRFVVPSTPAPTLPSRETQASPPLSSPGPPTPLAVATPAKASPASDITTAASVSAVADTVAVTVAVTPSVSSPEDIAAIRARIAARSAARKSQLSAARAASPVKSRTPASPPAAVHARASVRRWDQGEDTSAFSVVEGSRPAVAHDESLFHASAPVNARPHGGFFTRFATSLLDGRSLTESSLEPVIEDFRKHLERKNVASDIAEQLVGAVRTSIAGKKIGTFSRVRTQMEAALRDAVATVLTPDAPVDVLARVRDSQAARRAGERRDPFKICMVGVNGVGKSTSLSKIAYSLKHVGFSVLIAACDTFRAGAVEQLKTHATRLEIPLYDRGYGRDAADVAASAIRRGRETGADVVLIDTAGRMQGNEPLMRSLARLVAVNSPDLVLFVGEALCGNDGIDQVTSFNRALHEFAPTGADIAAAPHGIDGLFLTKFDTIDDKPGAALSLVSSTGKPIVFIGLGQNYPDMAPFEPGRIVDALLA